MIRLDFEFNPQLTKEQETTFINETSQIYYELKNTCEKLKNVRNTFDYKFGLKFGGKRMKKYDEALQIAQDMYDNLERCKRGEITSDKALFLFEKVNDNKYYVQINEAPFTQLKINIIKKDNFATRLLIDFKNNFYKETLPKMKYDGTVDLIPLLQE